MRKPSISIALLLLSFLVSSPCWSVPLDPQFHESLRLYQNRKFEESAGVLKKLVKQFPQKSVYWFNLGTASFMLKQYDMALRYFDQVVTLNTSFVSAAKLYRIKALRALGQITQANEEIEILWRSKLGPGIRRELERERREIEKADQLEEFALMQYQIGNLESSLSTLKSIGEDDLTTDGRILLGMVYLKLKQRFESEQTFLRLSKSSTLSTEQRDLVLDLLRRARHSSFESKPYWLVLDGAWGTTNNVYLDGRSIASEQSQVIRASLDGGYHFDQGKPFSKKASLSVNYESPDFAPELKTLNQTLQLQLNWQGPRYENTIAPAVQKQIWNGMSASQKDILSIKTSYIDEKLEVGLDSEFSNQHASTSIYGYLSGNHASFKPYLGAWGDNYYLQLYGVSGQDGSTSIEYGDGSRLPLGNEYRGYGLRLLYKHNETWKVFVGMSIVNRNFKEFALPGPKFRQDRETSYFARLYYSLRPQSSIIGSVESTANSSTLGATDVRDKNYDVMNIFVGINWEVF